MRHTLVFIVWNICSHVQSSTHFEWFLRYCFSLAIWEVCGGLGRRYISIILAVHGLFMDNTPPSISSHSHLWIIRNHLTYLYLPVPLNGTASFRELEEQAFTPRIFNLHTLQLNSPSNRNALVE